MRVLEKGCTGDDVRVWQAFLYGAGQKTVVVNGTFDYQTHLATQNFQKLMKLKPDGVVGQQTYAAAMRLGLPVVEQPGVAPKPKFSSPDLKKVIAMFGAFSYVRLAGGAIKITDGWDRQNIVKIHIPQLAGVEGAPADCHIWFHRKGAAQLRAMFAAWERAGLLKYLKTWGGSFVPRMVRGSSTRLSNHAFGSAFDINVPWNGLGRAPAPADKPGTVIPLVRIANDHGFYWGGHYDSRKDGMHFELAVLDMFPADTFTADLRKDQLVLEIPTIPAAPTGVSPSVIPAADTAAANTLSINPSFPSDAETADSPAVALSNSPKETPSAPPDNTMPAGDAPGAPAAATLKVEDWKPWVLSWLSRIWTAFTAGNFTQGFTLTVAAVKDMEHWYVYAAIAAVIFLISLFFVLLGSVALGVVLWRNRTEIRHYLTVKYNSLIDPNKKNLEIEFEKKYSLFSKPRIA